MEVLEHDPKKAYSDTTLLRADYLLILPECPDAYMAKIGKGLASQINTWERHKSGTDNILIVSAVSTANVDVCGLNSVDIADRNDWINYAEMYGNVYEEKCLTNAIKELRKKEETDNIAATSKMYGNTFEDEILNEWGSSAKDYESYQSKRPKTGIEKAIEQQAQAVKPKAKVEAKVQNDSCNVTSSPTGLYRSFTGKMYSRRILIA